MPRRSLTALVLATALIAVASGPASAALPSKRMKAADARAIERAIDPQAKALLDVTPAVYVGVWDQRKGSFLKVYGHAVRNGRRATLRDSVRIGSITKSFTAAVILQLAGEGVIDLDGTVAQYHPELAQQFPPLAALTIRQLLSMHSGLPDYVNVPTGAIGAIAENPLRIWQPQELIAAGLTAPVAPPGTAGYSTTNYITLQLIAERVTGRPLANLIATRLTGPLKLRSTMLPPLDDSALPRPRTHGYLNENGRDEITEDGGRQLPIWTDTTTWSPSYGQGGGGMSSTLRDLGTWAESLAGNRLLKPALASARLRTSDVDGLRYGLGIMRSGSWYGHEGEAIGWETIAFHNRRRGVTFVAMANASGSISPGLEGLLETLYPD